jgi:hypothetical protein
MKIKKLHLLNTETVVKILLKHFLRNYEKAV